MASRWLLPGCLLLALAGILIWELKDLARQPEPPDPGRPQALTPGPAPAVPAINDKPASVEPERVPMGSQAGADPYPTPGSEPDAQGGPLTARDWHEIHLWRESRGYISDQDRAIYQTYDQTTLTQLARDGDVIALQELAEQARAQGEARASAGLYQEAAVHGSTYALAQTGNIIANDIRAEADESQRREIALYGLAWHRVAVLRGDREVEASHVSRYMRENDLTLEPEEEAQVEQRAQMLYDDLNDRRQSIGLGAFDDSVPPAVSRLHQLIFPESVPPD